MNKNQTNEIEGILEELEKATAIIFSGFCEYHKGLPPSTDLSMCESCKKHYDEHISLLYRLWQHSISEREGGSFGVYPKYD